MDKYIALYLAPVAQLDKWMQSDPEQQKADMEKMNTEWDAWMEKNGSAIKETLGAGKVKRVTSGGVEDTRNDVMMYSVVEAESHEAAAEIFKDHPHLQIPESSIEVMKANSLEGM